MLGRTISLTDGLLISCYRGSAVNYKLKREVQTFVLNRLNVNSGSELDFQRSIKT